jgi:hypothetical protein
MGADLSEEPNLSEEPMEWPSDPGLAVGTALTPDEALAEAGALTIGGALAEAGALAETGALAEALARGGCIT